MRKVSVTASASGSGKTTVGRELARRLDVPFVELDALVHGPNWTETPDDELRRLLEPVLAGDGWVIDGGYRGKLGDLVFEQADVIVWIDLPSRVWCRGSCGAPCGGCAARKSCGTATAETIRGAFLERDGLFPYAFRMHFRAGAATRRSCRATRACASAASEVGGRRTSSTETDRLAGPRRRALNSAIQAATRRPIQIGVRIT